MSVQDEPKTTEPSWGKRADLDVLNRDIRRIDGPDKVTGRAIYTHDIRLPNMLHARILRHPVPRARINAVDVEAARRLPGVVHIHIEKEPGTEVRYSGDDSVIAVVAAETPEAALDGVRAIIVDATNLEPVVSPEAAKKADAPLVNYSRGAESNVTGASESGDRNEIEKIFEGAAAVGEVNIDIPVQHHVCLETHGHVVDPIERDGFVHIYASTQNVSGMPGQFRGPLERDSDGIRVLTPHMGGGFGSKFGPGLEGALAARIARETGRPVHLMLSRPDEFTMAGNRSGSRQRLRLAADESGKFIAVDLDAEKLGGQGNGSLPGAPYRYDVDNVSSKIVSVKTATDSNRAMRAPGHPQAAFGMESVIDEVAYALGMDPIEIRKRNLQSPIHHRQLDAVAKEIGWADHPNKTQHGLPENGIAVGIGFGVAGWGPGGRASQCDVTVNPDGRVVSATATQDLGTGARTYVAAIVAEELGLQVSDVTARIGDSQLPPSVASGGSVTTGSSAPAIKDGAHQMREALEAKLEPVLGAPVGGYEWKDGRVRVKGGGDDQSLSWKAVCALLREPLTVRGQFKQSLYRGNIHGAQAAKIEIDVFTGRIKVLKMVAIQDQGLPLNRMALRSQINGGMIQALSYGLLEERVFDEQDGYLLSENLDHYKIAGCQEMPEMISLIDDEDERESVCGMAEATIIPGHCAIANAIYNACGVRLTKMPFTPAHVLEALYGKI
ncbi:putative xanthine dehydrogenase subunit D [Planctomycetes bacterium Poly30]|uniref:Putative xanthine dehydrogenase subunit D n=1 Tax=Saltatorellus ferox TaxID=2528018 RepID=A0A518ETW7_9BACT|nr:putative xanthine dehydrogenase subunit D [Planctomycetes bacterium Poly30]